MASAEPLADLLLARGPSVGSTRLLAVDGPSGSGKTTLARAVRRTLSRRGVFCRLVSLDYLYAGWAGLDSDLEDRVCAQILAPLAAGRPARWQAYDWRAGAMGGWHDLGRPAALVLEGCGAGALRFAFAVSVLAWVEAPEGVRHARALQRDGDQVRPCLEQWWTLEAEHFRRNDTRARADLVIDTSSFAARSDT